MVTQEACPRCRVISKNWKKDFGLAESNMKVLLQRVSFGRVKVDDAVIGEIKRGLLLLVGIGKEDDLSKIKPMAQKIAQMRIFPDEAGRFHLSVIDIKGGILLIPQFTLFADTSKGRRPEFFGAMAPQNASILFDAFVEEFRKLDIERVEKGEFGAHMQVELENDGPVTIMVDN